MPFVKGQSGNPAGRKPGTGKRQQISEVFQAYLEEEVSRTIKGKPVMTTRLQQALEKLYRRDLKTFFAYAYGKPVETQIVQNPDGSNLIPPEMIEAAKVVARDLDKPKEPKP